MLAAAAKWRDAQRKIVQDSENETIANLKAKGMAVNEIDKATFEQAMHPVWKTYEPVIGSELLGLIRKYRD